MRTMETDVVVIGGGSTGAGVVRDVAMRGFRAILLDRADMAQGTSGRYHGLLHSGGRYIASDPESATECAEENAIVSRINADAVEKTGGLFVTTSADDEEYADLFLERARAAHVPAEEISPAEALRQTLSEYAVVDTREENINVRMKKAHYTLLPVWMLHTRWKDKDFLFAMNGQTGRLIGDLPVDKSRVAAWFAGISLPLMAVLAFLLLL